MSIFVKVESTADLPRVLSYLKNRTELPNRYQHREPQNIQKHDNDNIIVITSRSDLIAQYNILKGEINAGNTSMIIKRQYEKILNIMLEHGLINKQQHAAEMSILLQPRNYNSSDDDE